MNSDDIVQQKDYFHSLFSLNGKTCLITGAASGLGQHCAKVLARAGANTVLIDLHRDGLLETENALKPYPGATLIHPMDIRDNQQVIQGVADFTTRFSTLDVLVNCAGVVVFKPVFEQTEEDWDAVLDTDLKGMWLLSKAVAGAMIKQKVNGNIINVSSATSLRPQINLTPYGAAKAAVNHFTKGFAQDMLPYGIRVNCLAPGGMLTKMVEEFLQTKNGEDAVWAVPLKRFAKLDELDGCLLFMASNPASSYMTGAIVHVDGGLCISPLQSRD